MQLAIAAPDARVPRRVTAAAIAAALQAVFYWLILHETIEPTALQSPIPLQVTVFEGTRRPRPATTSGKPPLPAPARRKREPPLPAAARPMTLPPAATPAPASGPAIDWQQALRREVRTRDLAPPSGKLEFGLPRSPAATAPAPRFGWDYASTHRVQQLPEGGLLINLNDRCAVVLYVLPIPVCRIGHIPVNGGLFDHLRDRRGDRADGLP